MALSFKKPSLWWRADWFVALVVVAAVLVLHSLTDMVGALERRYYDFSSANSALAASGKPSDRIAIIAIDDQSLANLGRWPWPRDVHAQLIDQLSAAKVKAIAHTTFFFEPQTDRGLQYLRKVKTALDQPGASQSELGAQLGRVVADAEVALDTDARLAGSMGRAGTVLVPSIFKLGVPQGRPDVALPPFALKSALQDADNLGLPAQSSQQPIDAIGNAAAGVGHLNMLNDPDGAVRSEALFINYFGKAVPSLSLLLAAKSLNLHASDIQLVGPTSVRMGKRTIETDDVASVMPRFYGAGEAQHAFPIDSFYDVVSGKIPASKYAGKLVIIGATAPGLAAAFKTPAGAGMFPVETMAHITSSIIDGRFVSQPGWSVWLTLALVLTVVAYLAAGLPRLSAGKGAAVSLALLAALLLLEFGMLAGASVWIRLVLPAAVLLAGHAALTTKKFLLTEAGKMRSDDESAETNRLMGIALQSQGQLDMALDRFRRVPPSQALMDNLTQLALDFERKRQFNKAQAVYEHLATFNQGDPAVQAKIKRAKNLSETVILGGSGAHPGGALLLDGGIEKPMLGRYQIEKELGKGAMAVVYQGKDLKIGRVVAIKTMALSQEFKGAELEDARNRFFHEAETAGRLQHHNIVTIFDAGEEHDLAYIAMEFLHGKDLAEVTKPGHLLPVAKVLSVVSRVAEALDYAHRQGVVHRDIKPANIMYEPRTDSVKVTDFGIARITDASKTKTGLVLGTPSFMSPEQIAGKKVDGRSDLYSLGVTLYQMLTGTLPFRADSMAELMYKIANDTAPDIRVAQPGMPEKLAQVVALALAKQSEARYQNGAELAEDLLSLVPLFVESGAAGSDFAHAQAGARPDLPAHRALVPGQRSEPRVLPGTAKP
jgi:eukaryotic-like serine/threonine-protein kinase